ncbi:MAG: hypothetical protein L0Z70_14335, partial [Chloroflexi bacterium]|nr:hypothetical protein [Chloroflexota bacterium]
MITILKRQNLRVAFGLAMILALMLAGVASAAATLIDTFNNGTQNVLAFDGINGFNTRGGLTGTAIGGNRDVEAIWVSGDTVNILVDTVGQPDRLSYSSLPGTRGQGYIVWDGADATAAIDPDGLCSVAGCVGGTGGDLTGGGTNDGMHIELLFDDQPADLILRYYEGSLTDYMEYVLTLPGDIDTTSHVDFFVPFSSFTTVGAGANSNHIGAFALIFDASTAQSEGADISIDFFEADSFREFGDAPVTYGAPSHVPNGLRLGANLDIEAAGLFANATGDDLDQADDEDGVAKTTGVSWIPGVDGGSVNVVV